MGRKRDKEPEGLAGGQLSHNPFAALAGKSSAPGEGKITLPGGAGSGDASESQAKNRGKQQRGAGKHSKGKSQGPNASAPGKLTVRFEAKGHGGKTVTRISGLDADAPTLKAMARDLKKAMGTGARVEEREILVQGKLVERVAEWLTARGHRQVIRGN